MNPLGFLKNRKKQMPGAGLTAATIIPIASGKGGVGKSFVSSNLAMALAQLGHRVIAVDLDFGGANLHSFLGLPNRYPGIGDFLQARIAELDELLVPCDIPNLHFLPGDGKTPFMANIAHAQKIKLISRLKKLPADYVLLDLGAGSSYNTLDFFRLAPHGVMVTTPEPPAVMGMLVFLKNFLLRAIERKMVRHYSVRNMLREMYKQPMESQTLSIKEVHQKIVDEDPAAGEIAGRVYQYFRPRIVINMGENPGDAQMAAKISHTMGNILSIEADYFGFVYKDRTVVSSIRKRQPFLPNYRDSQAAENIDRIARRIEKFWDQPVKDSASLLINNVIKDSESRPTSSAAA
jgi:flagellar biosynthesis protein FlhG